MPERRIAMLLRYLPLAAVVGLISVAAVVSIPEPRLVAGQDKLNHALAFLAFAVTLRFARPSLRWGRVMLLSVAFGGAIEVAQLFVAGMDATFWDVVADAAGAGMGCMVPSQAWAWVDRWLSGRG